MSLSDDAKQADPPFLALREAYDHITKLPLAVALTSPAHMTGRQNNVERDRVLQVIDGLIVKASVTGAGAPSSLPSAVLVMVLVFFAFLTIKMMEPVKTRLGAYLGLPRSSLRSSPARAGALSARSVSLHEFYRIHL